MRSAGRCEVAGKTGWVPLQRANMVRRLTEADVAEAMRLTGQSEPEARAALEAEVSAAVEYWVNDLYQVAVRRGYALDGQMTHLNIRRRDGKPIFRDWRHFQWIKNQLVGEECEAVEIYPAESRLVDTSNKYHLWVFNNPAYRIPFGMLERDVIEEGSDRPGNRQRRFAK